MEFGIERITVHSEQAISVAGKTFEMCPEMNRNLIPLIDGEEKKSETEPLKIWGTVGADGIVSTAVPEIKARGVRVNVLHDPQVPGFIRRVLAGESKEIDGQ